MVVPKLLLPCYLEELSFRQLKIFLVGFVGFVGSRRYLARRRLLQNPEDANQSQNRRPGALVAVSAAVDRCDVPVSYEEPVP